MNLIWWVLGMKRPKVSCVWLGRQRPTWIVSCIHESEGFKYVCPYSLRINYSRRILLREIYSSCAECPFHCMASLTAINCDSSANLYPLINASKSTSSYINRVLSNCFSDWQATQELQESWTSNGSISSHLGHFLAPKTRCITGCWYAQGCYNDYSRTLPESVPGKVT